MCIRDSNYTLWDKLAAVGRRGDYDCPDADLLAQNRMTAGIYLTCQGLPFMQAGEEWGRTKHGDHNSYKGPLATNRLDWTRAHRPDVYKRQSPGSWRRACSTPGANT